MELELDSELKLYDFGMDTFSKLRPAINEKVPPRGLHDPNYLTAPSGLQGNAGLFESTLRPQVPEMVELLQQTMLVQMVPEPPS